MGKLIFFLFVALCWQSINGFQFSQPKSIWEAFLADFLTLSKMDKCSLSVQILSKNFDFPLKGFQQQFNYRWISFFGSSKFKWLTIVCIYCISSGISFDFLQFEPVTSTQLQWNVKCSLAIIAIKGKDLSIIFEKVRYC